MVLGLSPGVRGGNNMVEDCLWNMGLSQLGYAAPETGSFSVVSAWNRPTKQLPEHKKLLRTLESRA